jgi:hypothetical protein
MHCSLLLLCNPMHTCLPLLVALVLLLLLVHTARLSTATPTALPVIVLHTLRLGQPQAPASCNTRQLQHPTSCNTNMPTAHRQRHRL